MDTLSVWRDPAVSACLGWYRDVAENRRPAKFLIARRIPADLTRPEWDQLDALTPRFLDRWEAVKRGAPLGDTVSPNLVDLCVALCRRTLQNCTFCRWNCEVDRTHNKKLGTCKLETASRVSSYFHHRGEELIYRGTRGSGTIFFTSCNMRCAFCQNGDISTDKDNGQVVTPQALAAMAWLLRMEGCHNVNWVGGEVTIHLHTIVEAISHLGEVPDERTLLAALGPKADLLFGYRQEARHAQYRGEFNVPLLWNSNFFMTDGTMKILRVLMDVWLPDFKFGPGRCGVTLSRTPWYWETVTANLSLIHRWGEDFTIRHLVMPDHVECCTFPVLDWIHQHMPDAPVNVMDQYHPDTFCDPHHEKYDPKYRDIARRPTREEILRAFRHARDLGLAFESITYEKNTTGLHV